MSLLEIKELSLSMKLLNRKTPILRNVNVNVDKSEAVAIVGETGSGKTMTAKVVMGILPANSVVESGTVMINGINLITDRHAKELRKKISMVFQNPMSSLNPLFRVGTQLNDVLAWSVGKRSIPSSDAKKRIWNALEDVKLASNEKILQMYPFELSGGMRQRVMIAMALLREPELLIADEPTTALDVTTQKEIIKLLLELIKKSGMSLLLITHNLGIAYESVERTYVFYAGRVVEEGRTSTLFKKPLHPYTRGLIESIPSLDRSRKMEGITGEISQLDRETTACCFNARCPLAIKICKELQPELEEAGPQHRVACFVANQQKRL